MMSQAKGEREDVGTGTGKIGRRELAGECQFLLSLRVTLTPTGNLHCPRALLSQSTLDIAGSQGRVPTPTLARSALGSRRSTITPEQVPAVDTSGATRAHIEQVRLLILGMEQRLEAREAKLARTVERAEKEGKRFEEMHKGIAAKS
jgi:hypothetical protein